MKKNQARVFINGWFIGEISYDLPKRSGRSLPLPHPDPESKNVVSVLVEGPEGINWFSTGKLERNPDLVVHTCNRNPHGECVHCGSTT